MELCAHQFGVFPELGDGFRAVLEEVDCCACGGGEQGREGGGEGVRRGGDALVMNDFLGSGAEAAAGDEWAGQRSHDHVDFGGVDVLVFRDAAACSAEHAERPGFVED